MRANPEHSGLSTAAYHAGTAERLPHEPNGLSAAIRARGWRSVDLAERCGVSHSLVNAWRCGARRPDDDQVRAIAKALRRSMRDVRELMLTHTHTQARTSEP